MPKHTTTDDFHADHIDNGAFVFRAPNMTKTERDALSATDGMIIYNTTDKEFDGYVDRVWLKII